MTISQKYLGLNNRESIKLKQLFAIKDKIGSSLWTNLSTVLVIDVQVIIQNESIDNSLIKSYFKPSSE